MKAQIEVLRKMLLAMVEDIRVVLLRLASRTQTLRFYAGIRTTCAPGGARDAGTLFAARQPAGRLGTEVGAGGPVLPLPPPGHLQENRRDARREAQRARAVHRDAVTRCARTGSGRRQVNAEVYGRPKHIYSIWNKMRKKGVEFSEVYDVRALRIIVDDLKDCYTALGIVHNLWSPISKEFDDYISNPKGNNYRSLHTAVRCPDGRSLEIQIRTWEMHKHAELGVAAHWRYKEGSKRTHEDDYDEKIAWLRQLLTWKDEVADSSDWVSHYKQAALDETLYVITPQGKVVDLPQGATPVDFAYRVHTDLGHRCRGRQGSTASWSAQYAAGNRAARRDHHRQARRAVARLAQSGARLHSHQERAGQGAGLVLQPGARGNAGSKAAPSSARNCSASGRPAPISRNSRTSWVSRGPTTCTSPPPAAK
jgi:GTP pyrophosphokinase